MPGRTILALAIANLLLSSPVAGHEKDLRADCKKTKEKIRLVQSKMRSGYTRAQGEKLEAQLRKLRARRKKVCR